LVSGFAQPIVRLIEALKPLPGVGQKLDRQRAGQNPRRDRPPYAFLRLLDKTEDERVDGPTPDPLHPHKQPARSEPLPIPRLPRPPARPPPGCRGRAPSSVSTRSLPHALPLFS